MPIETHPAYHFFQVLCLTPKSHTLGQARDARLCVVAPHKCFDQPTVFFGMAQHVGSRTNHRHASKEYVDELGELIDARFPQKSTHPGNPGVTLHGLTFIRSRIDYHGPELEACKRPVLLATPHLKKKYRAFRVQLDDDEK